MSVLVKGMKMPENCKECMSSDLRTTIKCTEWTEISAGRRENERAWSCPLVELPEKHGDLIDREALYDDLTRFYENKATARGLIYEQPTVIEAEGEE